MIEKKPRTSLQSGFVSRFSHHFSLSAFIVVILSGMLSGCVPKKDPELVQNKPEPVQEVPSPSEPAIEKISSIYQQGKMYAEIGYTEDARKKFDEALTSLYHQPPEIRSDSAFVTFSQTLINNIHSTEMAWFRSGDTYTESVQAEQTNAILSEDFTFISEKEAEKERKIVEQTPVKYEIPVVLNKQVLSYIKAFSTRLKPVISTSLSRSGKYEKLFKKIFREEGVPEDLFYLPIVESGYRSFALSHASAKGIWQFMKGTARLEGLTVNWWVDERCDPEKATRAAAKHLKRLHNYYNDWYLALAAYNAGQGKVDRAIRKAKTRDFWKIAKHRWLLRRETRNYVPGFLAALVISKHPEKYGFNDLSFQDPIQFDTVTVDSCTDLRMIAKLSDTTVRNIQELNPQLRRLTTPISNHPFQVRIPKGEKQNFETQFAQLPKEERVTLRYHSIRPGQTLSQIAQKYQTSVSAIKKANNIRNPRTIRAGKTLVIPIGQGHDYYYRTVKDFTVPKARYASGKRLVHRVRRGDTLYGIALRYRTDIASIKQWNNLDSILLHPGQKLTVFYNKSTSTPQNQAQATTPKAVPDGYHRVSPGDTLYSLSRKYGVSIADLKQWNNMRSSLIHPGDLIRVNNI